MRGDMDQIAAMFTERPYVLAFLATFIVVCWAERGWQRMLLWLASGTFIGWLMEFSSTHNGFPFGHYSYYEANFPDELFIGGVPIFASLSFAFMTYFAYSAASTFLSRLERRGRDIERVDDDAVYGSLRVLVLAALITTWVDTVIDPVSLLGRYWFLGDLYGYRENGVHFGVPLSNYSGWLFTSVVIVALNQLFDALLRTLGVAVRGFHLPFKPAWALGTIFGNFGFMIAVTVYLMTPDSVPSSEAVGSVFVSELALSGAFVALAAIMIGRGLRRSEPVLGSAR
jgi:putative membrane protein